MKEIGGKPLYFWLCFLSIIAGIIVSWYAAIKALNTAYSEKNDHVLFWVGTVFVTLGILGLFIFAFSADSKRKNAEAEVIMLYRKLSQLSDECKGRNGPAPPGSSGPGLWSRFKGFFNRNTSVPPAGNPGEVNPFNQPSK
jgi:hypothetical protein